MLDSIQVCIRNACGLHGARLAFLPFLRPVVYNRFVAGRYIRASELRSFSFCRRAWFRRWRIPWRWLPWWRRWISRGRWIPWWGWRAQITPNARMLVRTERWATSTRLAPVSEAISAPRSLLKRRQVCAYLQDTLGRLTARVDASRGKRGALDPANAPMNEN
jgi:hypothetical protein